MIVHTKITKGGNKIETKLEDAERGYYALVLNGEYVDGLNIHYITLEEAIAKAERKAKGLIVAAKNN